MKLRMWHWLRHAFGYRRLVVPYGTAGWITLDERDWLQRQIFVTGAYESEVWESMAAFLVAGDTVWDVGAHIGSFAVRALCDERVRVVHAFEPDPAHAQVLERNLALNGGRYFVHRLALSSQTERRLLHLGPSSNTGLSSLTKRGGRGALEVECRSADEVVFAEGVPSPTLLKIDVEGWEWEVLRGAERLLRERPPRAIVFESAADVSGSILERRVPEFLREYGYLVRWIQRPSGIVEPNENYLAWRF